MPKNTETKPTSNTQPIAMAPTAPQVLEAALGQYGLIAALKKTFSTGSVGYYGNGKLAIEGQMYQVALTATLIGSKPTASQDAKA